MIGVGSLISVLDKSGASSVLCITILHRSKPVVGAQLVVVVKSVKRHSRTRKRAPRKGNIFRAVLVRTVNFCMRPTGYYVQFPTSSLVLIRRGDSTPVSSRFTGVISRDLREKGFKKFLSLAYDIA